MGGISELFCPAANTRRCLAASSPVPQRDRERPPAARRVPPRVGRPAPGPTSSRCDRHARRARRRHPQHKPTVEIRSRLGQRPHALTLAQQPVDRPLHEACDAAGHWRADRTNGPGSQARSPNDRPGSKLVSMNPCSRSLTPFARQSPGSRIRQPTDSCPQNDANSSSAGRRRRAGTPPGRPPAAGVARRSATRSAASPTARPAPPWRTPPRPPRTASSPARRRPRTPCASGSSRPGSPARAATDRTATRPQAGTPSADTCADRGRTDALLPHVIIDDRLATLEALLGEQLADPLALHPGSSRSSR